MYNRKYIKFFVVIILNICIIASIIGKAPKVNSENYMCSDATYHVLLTMKAYDETPSSIHKFLPIVSLGETQDKFIPWGATVSDSAGNYYYTSFSLAGFIAPYIFIKLFNLPVNEMSLYIFNSFLYILSAVFLTIILMKVYKDRISKFKIYIYTFIIYLFQTEILHSQGIVYWHQSLFQVLFLLQVLVFLNRQSSKKNNLCFWALCVINAYVEWSGYVANIGFAIVLFIQYMKAKKNKAKIYKNLFFEFILIIICNIMAFTIFFIHYISVIPIDKYIVALISRFSSRSFNKATISLLFDGYMKSYFYLIIITVGMLLIVMMGNQSRKTFINNIKEDRIIYFIFSFPIIENIIMLQHACQYTFDRLKMIFILILIFINVFVSLQMQFHNKKRITIFICLIVGITSGLNFWNYTQFDNQYRWKTNYVENNNALKKYISSRFDENNSIIAQSISVRGYDNLLFGSGIYENIADNNQLIDIAEKNNKRYAIQLLVKKREWHMDEYYGYKVYDLNQKTEYDSIINNKNFDIKLNNNIVAYNISDNNWINGISKKSKTILVKNNLFNLNKLENVTAVKCNNLIKYIQNVEIDEEWIRLVLQDDEDIERFRFPNEIEIVKRDN